MTVLHGAGTTALGILLLFSLCMIACGDDETMPEDKETPIETIQQTEEPEHTATPAEDVVITIGNLTDLTGPAAATLEMIDAALDDLVEYYNEEKLIPGVELKVISYDTSMDPSKYITGYQWLKERGADVYFTPMPGAVEILRPRIEEDGMVLFPVSATKEELIPPGNNFMPATVPEDNSYTLLKWIAENDWDSETNGPAKIGGSGWNDAHTDAILNGMQEYAEAHPDQYEWVGGYTTNFSFVWGPEVEALKDCDYVMPPIIMNNFVEAYRTAGYTATFIGPMGGHTTFLGSIHDAHMWEEIDGMIFTGIAAWWGDGTEVADFMEEILYRYRADEAEGIMRRGSGYGAVDTTKQILQIIANAVEAVGPENFDSDVLYNSAISYSRTVDGEIWASFSETKRASIDRLPIYKADGAAKDLFMVTDGPIPVVHGP